MIIYRYDLKTLLYKDAIQPQNDPVDGLPMIPADCTQIKPDHQPGMVSVWNHKAWEYKEDHTGKVIYNTSTQHNKVVDYYGTIEEGFTDIKPDSDLNKWSGGAWVIDRELFKKSRIQKVKLFAETTRSEVVGHAMPIQLAGFVQKAINAQAVISGTATSQQKAELKTEASTRGLGETVEQLAQKQLDKANALGSARSIIDALEHKAIQYITDTTDETVQIDATLDTMKTDSVKTLSESTSK